MKTYCERQKAAAAEVEAAAAAMVVADESGEVGFEAREVKHQNFQHFSVSASSSSYGTENSRSP